MGVPRWYSQSIAQNDDHHTQAGKDQYVWLIISGKTRVSYECLTRGLENKLEATQEGFGVNEWFYGSSKLPTPPSNGGDDGQEICIYGLQYRPKYGGSNKHVQHRRCMHRIPPRRKLP